ncbi:MAG: type II secretion system protein [Phycisphaeraceae bacterium JB051]
MKSNKEHAAFTLIKLLVVISIITLLMGIALPALKMARKSARTTQCASNLKNIGTIWAIYCDQNPTTMPNAVSLPSPIHATPPGEISILDALRPYMNSHSTEIYNCPEDDLGYYTSRRSSYEYLPGLAITFDPDNIPKLVALSRRSPHTLPVLTDAAEFHPAPSDVDPRQTVYHDTHVDWLFASVTP